jgi:predicted  nucleic acid-binding Zn-ribbon protein
MSLSGINLRLSNIESRLSSLSGASPPAVADNSEEVAKLGEKLATVESKADAGLNACNQVMMANKKDAETLQQRIVKLEKVVEKIAKSVEGLSKKSQDAAQAAQAAQV